jgi:3-oxoacyl-[acyl-carrier protein] reductase
VDLELRGRRAIVCASTRGLGFACAASLAREGAAVVVNGRTVQGVARAVGQLEDTAPTAGGVSGVAADLDTAEGRARLLEACPDPDILVTNNAGPPPRAFRDCDGPAWAAALEAHFTAPLALIAAVVDGMRARRYGRIVTIVSAMVKTPNPLMVLSVGPRTGLVGVCKALSREVAADNVTINNLLPERFDTERQRHMAELAVAAGGGSLDDAYAAMAATIAAGRLGRPAELGDLCAFLCSARAGFVSGQSISLDGGSAGGLF